MMRHIAAAQTFVKPAIVLVHVAARIAELVAGRNVVDEFRKRIVRQKRKTAGEAPLGFDKYSVIRRIADGRIQHGHVAELRKRPQQLRIAWSELLGAKLIDGQVVRRQVMAHVAEISDLY